jgi:hypothetical protein
MTRWAGIAGIVIFVMLLTAWGVGAAPEVKPLPATGASGNPPSLPTPGAEDRHKRGDHVSSARKPRPWRSSLGGFQRASVAGVFVHQVEERFTSEVATEVATEERN